MVKKILHAMKKMYIPDKWAAVLAVLALAALLFPLVRLAFYDTPWYDDYDYGRHVKSFVAEYGPAGLLDGLKYTVRMQWYAWQGTFSSVFMMALVPIVFGEHYYIGIIGILLFFNISCMIFVKTVCANLLKANRTVQVMCMVLVASALTQLIYTAQQGLYWYNSAVHYTFMHGCLFLLLSAVIRFLYARSLAMSIFLMICAAGLSVVCGGSNFVTALQGLLALLLTAGLAVMVKNRRGWILTGPAVIYGIAFYYSVSAPGNDARSAHYVGFGAVKSILYSFRSAAVNFWKFTDVIMLLVLCLFALIIWNTLREAKCSFRYPAVVSLFSFCFYATGFTPSYYGMGYEGLSRTWVVVKFTLQILLFMNTAYWLGWWMQRRKKRGKEIGRARHWIWAYAAAAVGVVLCVHFSKNPLGEYASWGAYYYVHSGQAANYYGEYLQRIEQIKSGGDVVELEPYVWRPYFLCKGELSTDPNREENRFMAEWYGKSAIYIKVSDEAER